MGFSKVANISWLIVQARYYLDARAKMLIYLCFFVYNALRFLEALAEHIDIDMWEGKSKVISRAYRYKYTMVDPGSKTRVVLVKKIHV